MEILYVSHCVPWPPDKGERIRAFYTVSHLLEKHRVHLACVARSPAEATAPSELRQRLASVRMEVLDVRRAVWRGFLGVASGRAFTTAFYAIPALQSYVRSLIATNPIQAAVLLSSCCVGYAPVDRPFLADLGDVDSEKRLQYAQMRFPGLPHRLEAHLLRRDEYHCALRARRTFLTTTNETELFERIAPGARLARSGNGVDFGYFNAGLTFPAFRELADRKYLVFVGMLDYFPNVDGVRWFAKQVFPELHRINPALELLLVGRHPTRDVVALGERDGISVTGAVDDVRPYLAHARAVIAPLRLARGVQNKVLEALAMGKPVLASEAVCRTFMPELPKGVIRCDSATDYIAALTALPPAGNPDLAISDATRLRFSWSENLLPILTELDAIEQESGSLAARHDEDAAISVAKSVRSEWYGDTIVPVSWIPDQVPRFGADSARSNPRPSGTGAPCVAKR